MNLPYVEKALAANARDAATALARSDVKYVLNGRITGEIWVLYS